MTQAYYLTSGERVPSVTTVLGMLDKGGLLKWYADRGWDAANAERDRAAKFGTSVHKTCERIAKGEQTYRQTGELDVQDDERPFAERFLGWLQDHVSKVLYCERVVISETHRYGGTLDLAAVVDGVPTLVDLKTSKATDEPHLEWRGQTAAYAFGLYETTGVLCQRRLVVQLPSNKPGELLLHWLPENAMRRDFEAFLACLQLYRWRQEAKPPVMRSAKPAPAAPRGAA